MLATDAPPRERRAPVTAGAVLLRTDVQLFVTSFLALYAELLCIRWMPAHVRVLSYFTNFMLIASFLGLGLGILSTGRRFPLGLRSFSWVLLGATLFVAASRFELDISSAALLYSGQTLPTADEPSAPPDNLLLVPVAFVAVALLFACIGRPLGKLLAAVTPPLRAYALDICGSLAGIAVFFVMSLTEQSPPVWFGGLVLPLLVLAGPRLRDRIIAVVPLGAVILVSFAIGSSYWWSPYYKIGLTPTRDGAGWALDVNDIAHQTMLPAERKEPFYRVPYELFGDGVFDHALIIGAGSGSDTSIALRHGVGQIDAVEIDPVILRLGRQYHPDQPFSDPRVVVHVDDGRSFLRHTPLQFDLIEFALPDSAALTSQFTSLRLESFLFTTEAFREARAHLRADGVLVLYNYYREPWLLRKLAGMLQDAFDGRPPFVVSYGGWGRAGVLVAGPRMERLQIDRPELAQPYVETRPPTPQPGEDPDAILLPQVGAGLLDRANPAGDDDPTPPSAARDDWPLIYLRRPELPVMYLLGLAVIAVISVIAVGVVAPRVRATASHAFNAHMFFLGMAFMLLETRSLVTFSLLFGSTWLVNSLVFFAVLCSVLLAVMVSARSPLRPSAVLYALLVAALLLAYLLPTDSLLNVPNAVLRYGLASVVAFLPVFVANLLFAGSFKQAGAADVAFASNLLGIMAGGMLEYMSLLIGYRQLLVLVIAFYLLSGLFWQTSRPRVLGSRGGRPRPGTLAWPT
jgi:hypothetical protein